MKIGDRVRTVREIGGCPTPVGSVVTLVAVEYNGFDFLTEDGQTWYGNTEAFKPLPAPASTGPRIADGTVCTVDSSLDWVAASAAGLHTKADHEKGPVKYLYKHKAETKDGLRYVRFYSINDLWAIPEQCLVPVAAPSALASWEPIEYRSQPDANGDCDFIQWDGIKGGWMVLSDAVTWATPEVFPTPEAAAEWVAKENANG